MDEKSNFNYSWHKYEKFDVEEAIMEGRKKTYYNKRQCPCQLNVSTLTSIGSGIQLYFWFIKRLIWAFLILSILSLPTLLFSSNDSGIVSNSLNSMFFHATIGKYSFDLSTKEAIITIFGKRVSSKFVSYFISICDLVGTVGFFIFALVLKRRMITVASKYDKKKFSVAEYSIEISGLPPDTKEREIYDFFNNLYDLSDTFNRFKINGKNLIVNNPKRTKVSSEQTSSLSPYALSHKLSRFSGSFIHDISLVQKNYSDKLDYYAPYKDVYRNIDSSRKRIQLSTSHDHMNLSDYFSHIRELSTLLKKRDYAVKNEPKKSSSDEVVGGIVTFTNEESRYRCLKEYQYYDSWYYRFFCGKYPDFLLFRGTHKLKIRPAAHPTDYNWENFSVSRKTFIGRQCVTLLITLIVLLFSIFLCSFIQRLQNINKDVLPSSDFCSNSLPLIYGHEAGDVVTFSRNTEHACDLNVDGTLDSFSLKKELPYFNEWLYYDIYEGAITPDPSQPEYCRSNCLSPNSYDNLVCIIDYVKYHPSAIFGCYCKNHVAESLRTDGLLDSLSLFKDSECRTYLISYSFYTLISILSVIIVLLFNLCLYYLFTYLGKYERHKSLSNETDLKTLKLFFGYLIGTAFIILITTSDGFLGRYKSSFLSSLGLFGGVHNDFTDAWYRDVGSSIILTLILSLFCHNLYVAFNRIIIYPCYISRLKKSLVRSDIVEGYAVDEFAIDLSIPYTLNIIFVTMIYSGGIPVLNIVGFLILGLQYVVDGYLLFRTARPPVYKRELMSFFGNILPIAVFLHLGFTGWMYGYEELFYPGSELSNVFGDFETTKDIQDFWSKLSRMQCFLYIVTFLVLLVVYLLFLFIIMFSRSKSKSKQADFIDYPPITSLNIMPRQTNKPLSVKEMSQGHVLCMDSSNQFYLATIKNANKKTAESEVTNLLRGNSYIYLPITDPSISSKLQTVYDKFDEDGFTTYNKNNISKYKFVENLQSDFYGFYDINRTDRVMV